MTAILELRLYQLTGLERDKIIDEYKELLQKIVDLMDILAKELRVLTIIKKELHVIREKHGNDRRTQIVADEGEMAIEDLIANEGVIITLTHAALIKRTNISSYRAQRRGGRGVIGMTTREGDKPEDNDFVEHLFTASTHDYLMFFTNTGRVYVERVHEIPDGSRASKGRSIANLLEMRPGEKVAALIRIESRKNEKGEDVTWAQPNFILFATQQGTVKKTALEDFGNVRKGGIIAIGIEQGDNLIEVRLTSGTSDAVLITHEGMSIRFEESDVRSMGRPATGVRGISLDKEDRVVALAVVDAGLDAPGRRRKRHRQAHRLRRVPHPDARRQGHHHDEDQRQDRLCRRRAHRHRRRRDHAPHPAGPDGPHAGEGHPRSRPQHSGREARESFRQRQADRHRARHIGRLRRSRRRRHGRRRIERLGTIFDVGAKTSRGGAQGGAPLRREMRQS